MKINDLEFGQEVEVHDGGWQKAKYISASVSDHNWHYVLLVKASKPTMEHGDNIRLPLKSRIRRGQPIKYEWEGNYIFGFFAGFDERTGLMGIRSTCGTRFINNWELLKEEELKYIGQDGFGWITEDE